MSKRQASRACRRGPIALLLLLGIALFVPAGATAEMTVPPGFQAETLAIPRSDAPGKNWISGLQYPTTLDFGPEGEMFVAERNGRVKVFDGPDDVTPTLVADITSFVMGRGDRGLLGMKLDPEYPQQPYMYLAYTHDAPIGGQSPPPDKPDDPSGADICKESTTNTDCVASGRIVRIELDPDTFVPLGGVQSPQQSLLVESWCQQFMSHSIGDIEFDSTGALLAGGGDGASWELADYGQFANPCHDPEGGEGPEGGSMRSQDLLTPDSPTDPTDYNGSIIRIDRFTGKPAPSNPLLNGADKPAERILADGFRNPFRFAFRPGSDELYVGDVGWYTWEEIDRLESPPAPAQGALNFGWPCYEGFGAQKDWAALAVDKTEPRAPLCKKLYGLGSGAVTSPLFTYAHGPQGRLFPGDACEPGDGASTTGLAFYEPPVGATADILPSAYEGALFINDSSRGCIWVMKAGANGKPDPTQISNFALPDEGRAVTPVDLVFGPDGALYVPNFFDSSIERIEYFAEGQPPRPEVTADKTFGAAPLKVRFDASGSSEPNGEGLHYAWDADGDGEFDDGGDVETLDWEFQDPVDSEVAVRVADDAGNARIARITVYPGDSGPPVPEVMVTNGDQWAIGDEISFDASATDPDGEAVGFDWNVVIKHCPNVSSCHTHPLTSITGAHGSLVAPPHEYPSHLELTLTARDARGVATKVVRELDPRAVGLRLSSSPPGLPLTLNATTAASPVEGLVIAGGSANVSAPETAMVGERLYEFASWSDGGARSHTATASAATELVAAYAPVGGDPGGGGGGPDPARALLHVRSKPPGVRIKVGPTQERSPFELEPLVGSGLLAIAPRRAKVGGRKLQFKRWNNNGARRQLVTIAGPTMLCAIYKVERRPHRTR